MVLSLRTTLLAGLAAALTLPLAAQDVRPQPVLEDDAVPVSAPPGEALTLPPAPRYPSVMQWPAGHARKLLQVIESVGVEGLDPADYRPGALRAAIETGAGPDRTRVVVGPAHRLSDDAVNNEIAPVLLRAGTELSKRLGFPTS